MNTRTFQAGCFLSVPDPLGVCRQNDPWLYPNAHPQTGGGRSGRRDVDECIRYAQESGAEGSKGTESPRTPPAGLLWRGRRRATALCWEPRSRNGGAERPAERGRCWSKESSIPQTRIRSSRIFVDRCLREKGYEVNRLEISVPIFSLYTQIKRFQHVPSKPR